MPPIARHGGEALRASRELGIPLDALKDFSLNANPYGPPKSVVSAIKGALDTIRFYPDEPYVRLRQAIASSIGAGTENVVVGAGVTEIIHAFMSRFVREGTLVLCPPTFSEYEAAARALGIGIRFVEPKGIRVNVAAIKEETAAGKASCVILCNPNNPTGEVICRGEIEEVHRLAQRRNFFLVVDEAYMDFVDAGYESSVLDLAPSSDSLVVLRSLTKPYGLPGLRVGYAVCSGAVAAKFNETAVSWRIGTLEECGGIAAVKDAKFLISSKAKMAHGKRSLERGILRLGCLKILESKSNFLFVDISQSGYSPKNLKWRLLSHGVLIKELSGVSGIPDSFIRVSVRDRADNRLMLTSLKNILMPDISLAKGEECRYNPCHFQGQDCSHCRCPFYPCLDGLTGGFFFLRGKKGGVWSCKDCRWIHLERVAEFVRRDMEDRGLDVRRSEPADILDVRKRALKACPP